MYIFKNKREISLFFFGKTLLEYINFIGKYSFRYDPSLKDGQLRPLNSQ